MMLDRDPSQEKPILDSAVEASIADVKATDLLIYRSDALPTWCPGCGYYGITHAMLGAMDELDINNDELVVVSGIGCAGRYPFFMNAYGFHSIHGRGIPVACGAKIANPDLTVLIVGGDGDGLGIGGGHLPHAIRRNVDVTYILFDNAIYGLTKGQTSPTTPLDQVTGTHPYGNPDRPLNPIAGAIAHGATFVARGWAGNPHALQPIMHAAFSHKGFSLVIATTPCITFDHVNILYDEFRDKWVDVPEEHDVTDSAAAMEMAVSDTLYQGVLLQQDVPTLHDRERLTIERAMD